MDKNKKLVKRINEEAKIQFESLLKEAAEKAPAVAKKLEELRKKLIPEMTTNESLGLETFGGTRRQKRLQVKTVSELLELPVNEIVLHMINDVKNSNDRNLCEMHLGHIYFYESE